MLALLIASAPWKPEFWLEKAGGSAFLVITLIIFAESGLFFGFFLPGDSLLFLAGFMTSSGADAFTQVGAAGESLRAVYEGMPPLLVMLPVFFAAAVLGDQVGYLFGKKVGPAIFTREDSRFFKQSHVKKAHDFLERYGPKTIFLARFVPIVRTFAPIVAGVGEMRYSVFLRWNILGALAWAVGITSLGAALGNVGLVRDHIEIAILGIVVLSVSPMLFELYRARKHGHDGPPAPSDSTPSAA